MAPKVVVFTDGSTYPSNPGIGGWSGVLFSGQKARALSGFVARATNNNMEAAAVLHSLEVLKTACAVQVCTDSMYVIHGLQAIQRVLKEIDRKGRATDSHLLKTNTEVWEKLVPLMKKHVVTWRLIPGHQGVLENELADKLAGKAAREQLSEDYYLDTSVSETLQRYAKKRAAKAKG